MKIALLGRSSLALRSGYALLQAGHQIALVATAKPADYYDAGPDDFRALATQAGAPFMFAPALGADDVVARLSSLGAGAAVSVNWPALIGEAAIRAFEHGILNAHAGDLPQYRGNACPNWAILNGETRVGVCIHEMQPDEVDSGPVLLRDYLPLTSDTYIGDVVSWLERRIPAMFVGAINGFESGAIRPEPAIDIARGLRCYPRRSDDARIDWRQPVELVHRLVRASSHPFGGAYTFLEGEQRVTIWRAAIYQHPGSFLAVPGQILKRIESDSVIACGDGCLRLTEVTLEGEQDPAAALKIVGESLRRRLI